MAKKKPKKFTASELMEKLRYRFADREYIVVEQVARGVGFMKRQGWVDAAVFSLWPSKGLIRSAFEIKVSRSDFIKELQTPGKNDFARDCFHEFWFVTAPGVVKSIDEIPEGVGWMMPHGKTLKIKKAAQRQKEPILDDLALCTFIRALDQEKKAAISRATNNFRKTDSTYLEAAAYQKAAEQFLRYQNRRVPYYVKNAEEIFKALKSATMNKKIQKEYEQIKKQLDRFQNEIQDAFWQFLTFAFIGLAERDKAENFFLKYWGKNEDAETLAAARARKLKHRSDDRKKKDKRKIKTYKAIIQLLKSFKKKMKKYF